MGKFLSSSARFILLLSIAFFWGTSLHSQVSTHPDDGSSTSSEISATNAQDQIASSHKTLNWYNREIAEFRSNTTQLSPAARVEEALERIKALDDRLLQESVEAEAVRIDKEKGYRFKLGEDYLFTVLESDLDVLAGDELDAARDKTLGTMEEIRVLRGEISTKVITQRLIYALIATLLFVISIGILVYIARVFSGYIEGHIKEFRHLKITRTDLRPHLGMLIRQIIKFASLITGLYLLCAYVAYVFSLFPLTAPWGALFSEKLIEFGQHILEEIVGGIPGVVAIIIIFFLTRWFVGIASRVLRTIGDDSPEAIMSAETSKATRRIVVVAIWIFGIVLAYPYVPGSGSEAFKGVTVLLGVMISLGSAGMINQIMSGFVLLYSGSVRTGEYVKVGEIEGTIKEIGILAVKFMTPRKEFITVPNAIVIGNSTTNFSRFSESDGVPVVTEVTIGYDTPWRQVNELLLKAVAATDNILEDPTPIIRQTELSDWYPVYSLTFYVRDPHTRLEILSYLNGNIQDAFNEAGVQIMSPHFKDQPETPIVVPKANWFTGTPVKLENPEKGKGED